ncbi:chromosome transmission fidelity protein [Rhypophila decipiens]|uniref:Chromosome transmission fidelity protein n=1 Tax=Rhypophila decipiens TaxID=261697 RepID=A0AAN6Y6I9_9PEZI|nr:chromosome transmission fidelity protein [Rhypophila decipiens]
MSSKPTTNPESPPGTSTASDSISINLYLCPSQPSLPGNITNPLPGLIQTPSGLAVLELQGAFNIPDDTAPDSSDQEKTGGQKTELGTISFPDYNPENGSSDTAWMKKVYLFIGKHQRLAGEVKKLNSPLGIIRRRRSKGKDDEEIVKEIDGEDDNDLEIVELVRYKIVFAQRPEPVTESLDS